MKHFIALAAVLFVGCASGEVTDAESSAGGTPPGPDYAMGGGGGYNPCGKTYKLVFPMPDGTKIVKEVPVYCTIWDGDFGDPPDVNDIERVKRPDWNLRPVVLPEQVDQPQR